jgi:hypothetical protein
MNVMFAAMMLAGSAAPTAEPARIIDAESRWIIDTSSMPDAVAVHKSNDVVSFPVYPEFLVRLNGPVKKSDNSGTKIEDGGQFMRMNLVNGREVFCSSKPIEMMRKGINLFRWNGTYVCLVDEDKDGSFEGVYEVNSRLSSTTPFITHGKDSGFEKIVPVSYSNIDRRTFDNPMKIGFFWWRGRGVDDRFHLLPYLKSELGERLNLNSYYGLEKGEFPGKFNFVNVEFHVSGSVPYDAHVYLRRQGSNIVLKTRGTSLAFEQVP